MLLCMTAALAIAPQTFRLWEGAVPGSHGTEDKDIPTLTLYQPDKPNGTLIVVCPGGGYAGLADHEGAGYALWLNRFGISAAVLKYRLGSNGYHDPVMLEDVSRAVRFSRFHAKDWGVDPKKIGIMGSSAGGHLASTILTHFDAGGPNVADLVDRQSSRPDFGILCYPVITMGEYTHQGSKDNLLGEHPTQQAIDNMSNEKRVTPETPPCFIWTTSDDPVVPVQNSLMFARALADNKVPFEIHVYRHGDHGLGLGGPPDSNTLLPWTTELQRWLKENGWL